MKSARPAARLEARLPSASLKLEARKGPVEVLVIDSAEKVPAEN
jgi:uncharacterized protein (TIGR03435 family)